MLDYLLQSWPILAGLMIYFVRLETKLATMSTDISWIKKNTTQCQQHLDQSTP